MKKLLSCLIGIFCTSAICAQTFDLQSDSVAVDDVYIVAPKILFELNQWNILPESHEILDSITSFLIRKEGLIVEIGVHADTRISKFRSIKLEQKRAESIRDYLIDSGIESWRLVPVGYGDNSPIISQQEINMMESVEDREKAHQTNRRTTLTILAKPLD